MSVVADKNTVDAAMLALRVSSDAYRPEVQALCDAAMADMLRVGVLESYVTGNDAKVTHAVVCYCKAYFGYDNDMASFFAESYRQHVCDMLNSRENEAAE